MKNLFILGVIYLLCSISVFSQSKKEWERVQSANSWNVYKQFIQNYPNGKYTEQAKQKLAQLPEPEVIVKKVEPKKETIAEPVAEKQITSQTTTIQTNEQILIKKGRYYVNEQPLKNKELKALLLSDPESAIAYKKSQSMSTIGYILEVPTILGLQLGARVGILPSLAGGMLVATPFLISSGKQLRKSIEIYNSKHSISTTP